MTKYPPKADTSRSTVAQKPRNKPVMSCCWRVACMGPRKTSSALPFPCCTCNRHFKCSVGPMTKHCGKPAKVLQTNALKQLVRAIVVVVVVAGGGGGDSRDVLVLDTCRRTIGGKNSGIDQSGRVKWCRQTPTKPEWKAKRQPWVWQPASSP